MNARPRLHRIRPSTYADYARLPSDGQRHELIAGEFQVSPAPSSFHQIISMRLAVALHRVLERKALVFSAPFDVVLSSRSVVQPDLVVVRKERKKLITKRGLEGAPDLVIEILSPGPTSLDTLVKKDLYARHGVPEYWMVDPDKKRVDLVRMSGAAPYDLVAGFERRSTLSSVEFPEVKIPLAGVFAAI
ncbi:MAG: Uma2 family endonuclease [Deltaproteobacteria bacterium]|nr:Uma2 family endonuclease [Deltaproteobacteria bacterium]